MASSDMSQIKEERAEDRYDAFGNTLDYSRKLDLIPEEHKESFS